MKVGYSLLCGAGAAIFVRRAIRRAHSTFFSASASGIFLMRIVSKIATIA